MLTEPVSQSPPHLRPWSTEKRDFLISPETYARTTQCEISPGTERKSHKEVTGLSLASPRQTAKRVKRGSTSESGLSKKTNMLFSEELNLRFRRFLSNLGGSSQDESAKVKQPSAGRLQVTSSLYQESTWKQPRTSSLPQVASLLPLEPPLKNITNFAKIDEEIVQMKVQYA